MRIILISILMSSILLCNSLSAEKKPVAIQSLDTITKKLYKEINDLNLIFKKISSENNMGKSYELLSLQKDANLSLLLLYDTIAFLKIYDDLDMGCKSKAADVVANRLLTTRSIIISNRDELKKQYSYLKEIKYKEIALAYNSISDVMTESIKVLDSITYFMRGTENK